MNNRLTMRGMYVSTQLTLSLSDQLISSTLVLNGRFIFYKWSNVKLLIPVVKWSSLHCSWYMYMSGCLIFLSTFILMNFFFSLRFFLDIAWAEGIWRHRALHIHQREGTLRIGHWDRHGRYHTVEILRLVTPVIGGAVLRSRQSGKSPSWVCFILKSWFFFDFF